MKKFIIVFACLLSLFLPLELKAQGGQSQPIRYGTTLPACTSTQNKNQFFLQTTRTLYVCNGTLWVAIGSGVVDIQTAVVGYNIQAADNQGLLDMANASPMTVTLLQPSTANGLTQNYWCMFHNSGPATLSFSPASGTTLNGSSNNISIGPGAGGVVFLDQTNNWRLVAGNSIPSSLVSGLPLASGNSGYISIVTDGSSLSDCTVGGGGSIVLCRSNGTIYAPLSGGNAGGVNVQGGTSYAPSASDSGKVIVMTGTAASTVTLPSTPPSTSWWIGIRAVSGKVTVSPNSNLFDTQIQPYTLYVGDSLIVYTDGTNYFSIPSITTLLYNGGGTANAQTATRYPLPYGPSSSNIGTSLICWGVTVANTGATTLNVDGSTVALDKISNGSEVALTGGELALGQLACAIYDSGTSHYQLQNPANSTSTVASGTASLGSIGSIASATCATVTVPTTGIATTDVITAGFNGDPTTASGFIPATTGMLTIIAYPTANNVNFKVCNNTSSSITPGAVTLNWRVVR